MALCEQSFQMNAVLFHYGLTPIPFTVYSCLKFYCGSRDACTVDYGGAVQLFPVQREILSFSLRYGLDKPRSCNTNTMSCAPLSATEQ